jgi:hypothetical protein
MRLHSGGSPTYGVWHQPDTADAGLLGRNQPEGAGRSIPATAKRIHGPEGRDA